MSTLFVFTSVSFATIPDIPSTTTTVSCSDSAINTNNAPANLEINWEPNTINLHWYNGNTEITVPTTSQSCTYDGALIPPPPLEREGYTFAGWKVRDVPHGYTRVDGIRNTASSISVIINTGIIDNVDDMEYELRVKPSTGSWYIFQSRQGSSGNIYGISGSVHGTTITANCEGNYMSSTMTRNTAHVYYIKYTHKNGNATLYVKDETTGVEDTKTGTYASYIPASTSIGLFGNMSGQYVGVGNVIYMARLKKNGELVRDYIPVVSSNNEIGFWERVRKNFVTASALSAVSSN